MYWWEFVQNISLDEQNRNFVISFSYFTIKCWIIGYENGVEILMNILQIRQLDNVQNGHQDLAQHRGTPRAHRELVLKL